MKALQSLGNFLDRVCARIVYWNDLLCGERRPFALLGKVAEPVIAKIGLSRTDAELSRRNKAKRTDPTYMGTRLEICINKGHWRRAKRIVEFADRGMQRKLLMMFIRSGKIRDTVEVCQLTGLKLTEDQLDELFLTAAMHADVYRSPEDGKRILKHPKLEDQEDSDGKGRDFSRPTELSRREDRALRAKLRMLSALSETKTLHHTGMQIGKKLKENPSKIIYN